MPQILTNNFKVYSAQQFVNSVGTNSLYLFIGKPTQWTNETNPDTPINNETQNNEYWSDSIAFKKINTTDVKQVIPRINWVAGTKYSQYDDLTDLTTINFYVLTSPDLNVYKCITNNNGSMSTDRPSGKSTSIITTADGYQWKFLYSLTDTDLLKFLTDSYMPVNTDTAISRTTIRGTIDSLIVTNSGINYSNLANLSVSISGNGTGARAGQVYLSSANTINYISMASNGQNYTYANVTITGGGGSNALARAVFSPYYGHGYSSADELGAFYVMINSRLDYAEGNGDFPIQNSYRRIGVIANPISNLTSTIATETTLRSSYELKISNATGTFTLDEIITGGNTNTKGVVLTSNVVSGNTYVRYVQPNELYSSNAAFVIGETIRGNTSMSSGIVTKIYLPNVIHNTGKVLYIENRKQITRTLDQAENIHTVIAF
jgi:hypothetical protein